MKMNMEQWQDAIKDVPTENIEKRLSETLEDIKILESVYMTCGNLNHLSKEFQNAAYKEREALCQLSSACYEVIRLRSKQTT